MKVISLRSGTRQDGHYHHLFSIGPETIVTSIRQVKGIKVILIRKEEVKWSLFAAHLVLCINHRLHQKTARRNK